MADIAKLDGWYYFIGQLILCGWMADFIKLDG
jgi:hypothetical protein